MNKYVILSCLFLLALVSCDNSKKGQATNVDAQENPAEIPEHIKNKEVDPRAYIGGAPPSKEEEMVIAGKNSGATDAEINAKMKASGMPVQEGAPAKQFGDLPPSCTFLPEAWVNNYFGLAPGTIKIKDATAPSDKTVKSCFFRWDNGRLPNSGLFLQLQSNPYPAEIPQYGSTFIQGKLDSGESAMGEVITNYSFKKFDIADGGAYSDEQGKFFWRIGEKHVFMLAFNLGLDKKTELKHAKNLAKQIMSNYGKLMPSN